MTALIDTLIDKQDNFEVIRDQVAGVLVAEISNQQTLATASGKNANDWKLRVFLERSNPWEQLLNSQDDISPIVNVWFDNLTNDPAGSNIVERQKASAIINIDCYGFGQSENDDDTGGHKPGDREAALAVHKALRLVRNILMSAQYTYLALRGIVWQRWVQSITVFQPQLDGRQMQQIVGARLALRVVFNEFSPQVTHETLELISAKMYESESGELLINADYQYPLTP